MKRQAIETSVNELRELAERMREEQIEMNVKENLEVKSSQKILVTIINKEGLSDTWKFEK